MINVIVRPSFCHRIVFVIFMPNSGGFVVHYQPGGHCSRDVFSVRQNLKSLRPVSRMIRMDLLYTLRDFM